MREKESALMGAVKEVRVRMKERIRIDKKKR